MHFMLSAIPILLPVYGLKKRKGNMRVNQVDHNQFDDTLLHKIICTNHYSLNPSQMHVDTFK